MLLLKKFLFNRLKGSFRGIAPGSSSQWLSVVYEDPLLLSGVLCSAEYHDRIRVENA
jgi:hypothetical protein